MGLSASPEQVLAIAFCSLTGCIALAAGAIAGVEYATSASRAPRAPPRKTGRRSREGLAKDAIGPVEAAAQSFGAMSPIMALCLVTPIIARGAGLATPAAILLAGAASLLCGRTIGRFAAGWPSAGSLMTYATVSLGPQLGLCSGICYTMAMSLLTVGGVAFLAQFAEAYFQSYHALSGVVLACCISLVIGVVCYLGVQVSTRVQLVVTVVSAFAVLLLGLDIILVRLAEDAAGPPPPGGNASTGSAAATVAFPGVFARLFEALSPTTAPSFPGFCKATLSALLIFAGYESAAAFAEETKNASRTVPKAIVFTVFICGVFYCWTSLTLALGYNSGHEWAYDSSTLVSLGTRYAGRSAGSILFLAVLFDGWAGSLACVNLVSRLYFALARQGFLPQSFRGVSGAYGTPHVAIATITCATMAICAGTVSLGGSLRSIFSFAVDGGSVLIQVSYFLVMVGGWVQFKSLEAALAAVVPLGAVFGSLLGAELSPGYAFALAFLVVSGLAIACVAQFSARALTGVAEIARAPSAGDLYARDDDAFDAPPRLLGLNLQEDGNGDDEEENEPLLGPIRA
jgi:amino acid transporter